MQQKKHVPFSEEKIEEQPDQHIKLKKNGNHQLPANLDFKYRNLLLWIPIIAGLAFVAFGIVRESMKKDEKFYCYKGGYIPSGFKFPFPENSPRQLLVNTRYSFKMYVDSYDHAISKKIAQNGTYQPSNINLIGHIVKNGDKVLVAGSHLGLQAIIMGKIIGQSGKLHIFTPTQFQYNITQKNIYYNQLSKITQVHKYQPSDTKQQGAIEVISGLNKSQTQSSILYSTQTIQYDRIDSILSRDMVLNFAYINVDKFGIKALKGMEEVIMRSPQLVIMVKWQVNRLEDVGDGEGKLVLDFLAKQGYKSYTYKGGSYKQSCTAGQFLWQGQIEKLLNIRQQMLLLFPNGYSLPR